MGFETTGEIIGIGKAATDRYTAHIPLPLFELFGRLFQPEDL